MLTALLFGFTSALLAPMIFRPSRRKGRLIALVPLGLSIYFVSLIRPLSQKGPIKFSNAWVPDLGINLSFYLDGLSLLFAVIISFIGVLVVVYAGSYFSDNSKVDRFYTYILFFMSTMLGMVLADNIITLFVFWELTSVSSYLLIGFHHEKESARKAAWQALLVTGFGGLTLLTGLLLLGHAGGSYELSELLGRGDLIKSHPTYPAIFILIAIGAFTKSAQFPFHFWLPDAMEAPTPVSTYLHSATMVKAGIYLLARMNPVLGDTFLWHVVLVSTGAVTMLMSAYMAIKQTDLKKILAYSTVSLLGTLVFLIGTGTHSAFEAAMAYIIIHALYKAALFLVAGIVDHETGTRDIHRLSGLGWKMPITAGAAALAGFSMAGLPPLFGFIGKELLYGATLAAPLAASLLTGVALTTNAFLVVAAGMAGLSPFFGAKNKVSEELHVPSQDPPHDPPIDMWCGPVLLAGLGIIIGLLPNTLASIWVSPAVAAITGEPVHVSLALMHGLTLQLFLSIVTFCCGVIIYIRRKKILDFMVRFVPLFRLGPSYIYQLIINGMNAFARLQTRILQSGHLHYYILIVIITTVFTVGLSLLNYGGKIKPTTLANIRVYEWVLVFIILTAIAVVVRALSRLVAIIALGVLGYCVVLFYIMYGAPDLAMTQFAIDTLTVILLMLVIYRLPRYSRFSTNWERIRDAVPAISAGGLITILILFTLSESKGSRVSAFFSENAYLQAKGRNIVNVILVDFRSLDTMGEVTVLAAAGIGVFSLLKLTLKKEDK